MAPRHHHRCGGQKHTNASLLCYYCLTIIISLLLLFVCRLSPWYTSSSGTSSIALWSLPLMATVCDKNSSTRMQFKCPLLPVVAACPCVLQQSANIPTNAIILFYLLTNPCTSSRSLAFGLQAKEINPLQSAYDATTSPATCWSSNPIWPFLGSSFSHFRRPSFRQSIYPTSISQECSQSPLVVRLSFCSTESQHHLLYISNVTGTLCQFQFIVPSPEWLGGWRHPPWPFIPSWMTYLYIYTLVPEVVQLPRKASNWSGRKRSFCPIHCYFDKLPTIEQSCLVFDEKYYQV